MLGIRARSWLPRPARPRPRAVVARPIIRARAINDHDSITDSSAHNAAEPPPASPHQRQTDAP